MSFMEDVEVEEPHVPDDELYARLNLARDCTPEEISAAFRRLSRIFHPDKHSDPTRRLQAQTVFQNIKKAFDVLSDSRQRAIYDMYGKRGLEMHGWELMLRTPTVAEIRAEHERLQRRMEENRIEQHTHPSTRFSFGIDASDVFDRYLQEPRDERFAPPRIEAGHMSMQQSVVGYLNRRDTLKVVGRLSKSSANKQTSILQIFWQRFLNGGGHVDASVGLTDKLKPIVDVSVTKTVHPRLLLNLGCNLVTTSWFRRGGPKGVLGAYSTMVVNLAQGVRGQMTVSWDRMPVLQSRLTWTTTAGHKFALNTEITAEESQIGISHVHEFTDRGITAEVGLNLTTQGLLLNWELQTQVTSYTKVSASFKVGVPVGVVIKLKVLRGSQTYLIPVNLSDNVDPVASFYGAVVPLAIYYVCKRLLFDTWHERERRKLVAERRRETAAERAEKRRDAEASQLLMMETVRRVREEEAMRRGLLIEHAVYGCAAEAHDAARQSPTEPSSPTGDFDGEEHEATVTDVTVPLEVMIHNSTLILPGHEARWELPGFYDPCPEEPKLLLVRYRFRGQRHEASFADNEAVRLPQERHRLDEATPAADA